MKKHKTNCQCCFCKAKRGEYRGENNPSYINGKTLKIYKCKDCGTQINMIQVVYNNGQRCHSCEAIRRHNLGLMNTQGKYIDGRTLKKYYCIDCGKLLKSYMSKRCRVCAAIERQKTPENCPLFGKLGKQHPAYINGSSKNSYGLTWTESLKESIRKRDNFECQNCSMTENKHLKKYHIRLSVHHIDYNKKNCITANLITLCRKCHNKTTKLNQRDYWFAFFTYLIENIIN